MTIFEVGTLSGRGAYYEKQSRSSSSTETEAQAHRTGWKAQSSSIGPSPNSPLAYMVGVRMRPYPSRDKVPQAPLDLRGEEGRLLIKAGRRNDRRSPQLLT